jgi:hypothetical protein
MNAKQLMEYIERYQVLDGAHLAVFRQFRIHDSLCGMKSSYTTPLHMLACFCGETWIEDGFVDALGQFLYFKAGAVSNELSDSEAPVLIFPTIFLSELQILYDKKVVNFNVRAFRERLRLTTVRKVVFTEIREGHYSCYMYDAGLGTITHFCSIRSAPLRDFVGLFKWMLEGVDEFEYPRPVAIDTGDSPIQPAGSGSCGIVTCNRIALVAGVETRVWSHLSSRAFRNEALGELLAYHVIAGKRLFDEKIEIVSNATLPETRSYI